MAESRKLKELERELDTLRALALHSSGDKLWEIRRTKKRMEIVMKEIAKEKKNNGK